MNRAILSLITIASLLLTWPAVPVSAQGPLFCPDFATLDLSPGEGYTMPIVNGYMLRIGQASYGIRNEFGNELPQWPAYTLVPENTPYYVENTAALLRSVFYCYTGVPTQTPTRTPTRTPTQTPTNAATNTPVNTATNTPTAGTPTVTPMATIPNGCYYTSDMRLVNGFYRSWFAELNPNSAGYVPGNWNGWKWTTNNEAPGVLAYYESTPGNYAYYVDTPGWDTIAVNTVSLAIISNSTLLHWALLCPPSVFITPTVTNTAPTSTIANTQTSTPTSTPTETTVPTATVGGAGCSGTEYMVPPAPNTVEIPLTNGSRFVAAEQFYVNLPNRALLIRPGEQYWTGTSGTYVAYNLGEVPIRVVICLVAPVSPTATFVATPTAGVPVLGTTPVCFPLPSVTATIAYAMPDLGLVLPTLRPLGSPTATGTITATASLSTTAVVAFFATFEAGISTPAAQVATMSATYNGQTGAQLSATTVAYAAPALSWMVVFNPLAPAWQIAGGPLWAMAPILLPVAPIIGFFFLVLIARTLLYVIGWILKGIDLVFKFIEAIPGE